MALKMFLTFAETGHFGLGEETGLDHDSEFEAQVAMRLRSLGYDVKAQIGASGFRVDRRSPIRRSPAASYSA